MQILWNFCRKRKGFIYFIYSVFSKNNFTSSVVIVIWISSHFTIKTCLLML